MKLGFIQQIYVQSFTLYMMQNIWDLIQQYKFVIKGNCKEYIYIYIYIFHIIQNYKCFSHQRLFNVFFLFSRPMITL